MAQKVVKQLAKCLTDIISETNGISINETLELAVAAEFSRDNPPIKKALNEFRKLLAGFQQDEVETNGEFLFFPFQYQLQNPPSWMGFFSILPRHL